MFSRSLAKFSAFLPTPLKYRLAKYKSIYTKMMSLGESVTEINTQAGKLSWKIDRLTSQTFLLGTYEPYMQAAFIKFVQPGMTVYDVGAHAGFHTLFCGLLVGETGRVIAFEPLSENRTSIEKQLAINPGICVNLSPFALSDRNGDVWFDSSISNSQGFVSEKGEIKVAARTIDKLVNEDHFPPPQLIKIDVEGHERQVLEGALEAIERYRPVILCDYNDDKTLSTVENLLKPLFYQISPGPPVVGIYKGPQN